MYNPSQNSPQNLSLIPLKSPKIIEKNDNLTEIFLQTLKNTRKNDGQQRKKLQEGDIIAIVSKVVSITEGQVRSYKNNEEFYKIMREEADEVFEGEMHVTITQGILIPTAGMDKSNASKGKTILWPRDAYQSAEKLREKFIKKTGIKKLGVLIFDSHTLPLRRGISGIAVGYAGFQGVEDCRGQPDLYGRKLEVTTRNMADNLASAATLLTGEADERIPFVLIRNAEKDARLTFTNKKIPEKEIKIKKSECIYGSLIARRS